MGRARRAGGLGDPGPAPVPWPVAEKELRKARWWAARPGPRPGPRPQRRCSARAAG